MLLVATFTDLQRREVPGWLTFGGSAAGVRAESGEQRAESSASLGPSAPVRRSAESGEHSAYLGAKLECVLDVGAIEIAEEDRTQQVLLSTSSSIARSQTLSSRYPRATGPLGSRRIRSRMVARRRSVRWALLSAPCSLLTASPSPISTPKPYPRSRRA